MNNNIIIYKNGEIDLNISVKEDTIWLKQDEIAQLFDKDRTVITRHINNILKDEEVDKKSNVHFLHIANSDKPVKIYSLDIKKHNEQYPAIEVKAFKDAHNRFLIIDEKEIYHFGASLKDLGKKWFAFSKMDISSVKILDRLKEEELI